MVEGLATGIVLMASSFLLGAQFTHWSVDHRTLWINPVSHTTIANSLFYYSNLSASVLEKGEGRWILRIVQLVALSGLVGLLTKLRKSSIAVVFDLASLVLLLTGVIIHTAHVIPLLRTIPNSTISFDPTSPITLTATSGIKSTGSIIRTIQSIASLNAIISVTLTGIIGLQLAQIGIERSLALSDMKNSTCSSSCHPTLSIPAQLSISEGKARNGQVGRNPSVLVRLLKHDNPLDIRPAS